MSLSFVRMMRKSHTFKIPKLFTWCNLWLKFAFMWSLLVDLQKKLKKNTHTHTHTCLSIDETNSHSLLTNVEWPMSGMFAPFKLTTLSLLNIPLGLLHVATVRSHKKWWIDKHVFAYDCFYHSIKHPKTLTTFLEVYGQWACIYEIVLFHKNSNPR